MTIRHALAESMADPKDAQERALGVRAGLPCRMTATCHDLHDLISRDSCSKLDGENADPRADSVADLVVADLPGRCLLVQ